MKASSSILCIAGCDCMCPYSSALAHVHTHTHLRTPDNWLATHAASFPQVAAGKRTQLELEDTILHLLATATGSMLDNVELINTLDESKTTWEEVNESLRVAEETAQQIEAASAQYRPCSVRAAILYFVLNDLASECGDALLMGISVSLLLLYWLQEAHLSSWACLFIAAVCKVVGLQAFNVQCFMTESNKQRHDTSE